MNRQWYRMGEGNVENRGAIYIGQDRDEQRGAHGFYELGGFHIRTILQEGSTQGLR